MMKRREWLDALKKDAFPDVDECIHYLGSVCTWLHDLKSTPQDPEWHGEGDVYIHTGMVLDELYGLLKDQAAHITGEKRQALILGALFHDIGKPVTVREREVQAIRRIVSPQHEAVGRSYLAFLLPELELSHEVIYLIMGLVGEHHRPKLLMVKNQGPEHFWLLSRCVDIELVYWLEVADMCGRICLDIKTQLMYLEEFKLFCKEYGVWKSDIHNEWQHQLENTLKLLPDGCQDYVYSRAIYDMERATISTVEEAVAKTYQRRECFAELMVLCGPSGSGKSTWVKQQSNYQVISLDVIRQEINGHAASQANVGKVLHLAKDRLKACLRKGVNVIWDATNLRYDFRKIVCDIGKDYHALVTLVVFQVPRSTIYQGNRNRTQAVPDEVLARQFISYQWPTPDEAHRYCIVNDKGQTLLKHGYYSD
ncbi:AAA family ATPase [Zooshikella harenae]|uniref:AAA family ATPase n=1 Tax=Zooshikella harenae TaxID=2827238 RepID=A0ABS5ZC47_9GAMM|nr:AAA family ATPase [Zooshikella harenae]MBU2711448.1 AAA family ATPase [Zooshikella harenae]